jgi:hypothetical protein
VQSVVAGMGLSLLAMAGAAAGWITPVAGAVLQEGIDLAVLLNALRALGGPALVRRRPKGAQALATELAAAHRELRPRLDELGALVSRLDTLSPSEARAQLLQVRELLFTRLLPHEEDEQERAYPVVARMLPGEDPTGPLIQTHQELHRLSRLYARLLDAMAPEGPGPDEVRDLRRALAGLHAILTLHMAQEEDFYSLLQG